MPDNQIFNFIDTPNFICEITSDLDQPHTPLIKVKLTSTDTFIAVSFYATPEMLEKLAKLLTRGARDIDVRYKKFWEKRRGTEKKK